MEINMKTVRVVAAVIKAINENGEPIIFATQRGYGDFKGGWEFPGGKIEPLKAKQNGIEIDIERKNHRADRKINFDGTQ